jgi:Putative zinc-finger
MKGCDEYVIDIQLYVDKELLSGQDLKEFSAHLLECVACRQQVEADIELSRMLRRSKPLCIASDALRERIIKTTVEASHPAQGAKTLTEILKEDSGAE